MTVEDKLIFRIGCALNMANMFRSALEANGNHYHGLLTPNLTSITDVLHIPFDILVEQSRMTSGIRFDGVRVDMVPWEPSAEMLTTLKALLVQ